MENVKGLLGLPEASRGNVALLSLLVRCTFSVILPGQIWNCTFKFQMKIGARVTTPDWKLQAKVPEWAPIRGMS
jgi:hypothetical protein